MAKYFKICIIAALVMIIALLGLNSAIFAIPASSFLAGGFLRGGCCSSAAGGAAAPAEEEMLFIGLQFYLDSTGPADADSVEAILEDFGCHREIHIYKDGLLAMRVGYANGQAYEMP